MVATLPTHRRRAYAGRSITRREAAHRRPGDPGLCAASMARRLSEGKLVSSVFVRRPSESVSMNVEGPIASSSTQVSFWQRLAADPRSDVVLVVVIAFLAYTFTLSPTITWEHDATDSAELAAAAFTFGVPHPTGYPLWLLIAAVVAHIPFGSDVAWRLGFISAACASAAAGCVTVVARRVLMTSPEMTPLARPAALVAGMALATSPAVWNVAVVTETYALHLLLVTVLLVLTVVEAPAVVVFLLAGLALANHSTAVFAVAVAASIMAWRRAMRWWSPLFTAPGIALYFVLMWRATQHPASNWGDPETLPALYALVSGSAYHYLLASPFNLAGATRVVATLKSLVSGFPLVLWPLAVLGVPDLWRQAILRFWVVGMGPYLIFPVVYRAAGAEHYLLPVYILLALAAGYGWVSVIKVLHVQSLARPYLAVTCLGLTLVCAIPTALTSSLRDNDQALAWATSTMLAAPQGATIQTSLDQQTFPLWYAQRVLGLRPDVRVIDERLIGQPRAAEAIAPEPQGPVHGG